jgi:DNA-binding PadR family transcriptional regulator
MNLQTWAAAAAVAVVLISVSCPSHAGTAQASQNEMIRAVNQYLADHGDLCVGKFTWPRIVTPEDRQAKTNDAVQLPVLERLGLVESTEVAATDESSKVYSLTAKGRKYYLQKRRITLGAHDRPTAHDADLCVGRLSLDKVVKWSPPEQLNGHLETVVRYTYHIKSAEWMDDPQARQVFPVIDRIIRHEDHMLMSVTVRFQDGKWLPVLPTL